MATYLQLMHDSLRQRLVAQTNRRVSWVDIDSAINRAQDAYFGKLIGAIQGYQPGRPIPPAAAGQTERIIEELVAFRVTSSSITPTLGIALSPDGMAYPLGLVATYAGSPNVVSAAKAVDDQRWDSRVASLVKPPTNVKPIWRRVTVNPATNPLIKGFEVYPLPTWVVATYYANPRLVNANIASYDAAGRPVWVDVDVVDLQWPLLSHAEILNYALRELGLELGDQAAQAFGSTESQRPN